MIPSCFSSIVLLCFMVLVEVALGPINLLSLKRLTTCLMVRQCVLSM